MLAPPRSYFPPVRRTVFRDPSTHVSTGCGDTAHVLALIGCAVLLVLAFGGAL